MPLVVEYLLIVKESTSFCQTAEAFTALLNVDSSIQIDGSRVRFDEGFECEYAITSGEVKGKPQRYFHLRFSADDCEGQLEQYSALLKVVRSIMHRLGGQPETLWDDISFYYSASAYRLVHRTENLMRKLIANFMFVTVGAEWVDDSIPDDVRQAIGRRTRTEYLNILHRLDFIHLADFLLQPYSAATSDDIVRRLEVASSPEDLTELKRLIPQSNWTRYFSGIVECDDSYISKKWKALYNLRCKVAHNAIVSRSDYEDIRRLAAELETVIERAIRRLPQVEVPQTELQQVAERAASSTSSAAGRFLAMWRELERRAAKVTDSLGEQPRTFGRVIEVFGRRGVFNTSDVKRAKHLLHLRNRVVHFHGEPLSPDELDSAVYGILRLIEILGSDDDVDPEAGVTSSV